MIKYEIILSKITLIVFPVLILLGLYTITIGLVWLLTHQIPYESLGVDLHQFVSSIPKGKSYLICLCLSKHKKIYPVNIIAGGKPLIFSPAL